SSGLLDDLAGARELGAAQDVAATHDDGQLYTALADLLDLASDVERLVDADPRLAGIAEALPAELENNAAILRRLRGSGLFVHDMFVYGPRNHFPGLWGGCALEAGERRPRRRRAGGVSPLLASGGREPPVGERGA